MFPVPKPKPENRRDLKGLSAQRKLPFLRSAYEGGKIVAGRVAKKVSEEAGNIRSAAEREWGEDARAVKRAGQAIKYLSGGEDEGR